MSVFYIIKLLKFLVSLISFIVIGLLFISEIMAYLSFDVTEQLFVDSTSSEMKVDIHFDIIFHKLACECNF